MKYISFYRLYDHLNGEMKNPVAPYFISDMIQFVVHWRSKQSQTRRGIRESKAMNNSNLEIFLRVPFLTSIYRAVGGTSIAIAVLRNRCAIGKTYLSSVVWYRHVPRICKNADSFNAIFAVPWTLRGRVWRIIWKCVIVAQHDFTLVISIDQITIKGCSCTLVYQCSNN